MTFVKKNPDFVKKILTFVKKNPDKTIVTKILTK